MTIAAVYRIDDRAVFLSDFRNTSNEKQTDVSLKFINIGDSVGIFLSGDALFWQRAIPLLKQCVNKVTLDNVTSIEGTFYETISNAFWEHPPVNRTRAIGFVINNLRKENVLFSIDIVPKIGVRILPIDENSCYVIGSGSLIKDIDKRVSRKVEKVVEIYGYDLYQMANGMRKEVQDALVQSGIGSFQKLGISPYMALHSLAGSHFMIRGEEIQGEIFTDNKSFPFHYSFSKDSNTNEIFLTDYQNGKRLVVNNVSNLQDALRGERFDPEYLSIGFDAEKKFLDRDCVYLFHQWVNQLGNEILVYRSIRKIDFVKVSNGERIEERLEPLIAIKEFPIEQQGSFPDCRDQYFVLESGKDNQFMEELHEEKLFDNEWLSSFIKEYYSVFYLQP